MRRKATRRFERFRSATATELFISLHSLFLLFVSSCCGRVRIGPLAFARQPPDGVDQPFGAILIGLKSTELAFELKLTPRMSIVRFHAWTSSWRFRVGSALMDFPTFCWARRRS